MSSFNHACLIDCFRVYISCRLVHIKKKAVLLLFSLWFPGDKSVFSQLRFRRRYSATFVLGNTTNYPFPIFFPFWSLLCLRRRRWIWWPEGDSLHHIVIWVLSFEVGFGFFSSLLSIGVAIEEVLWDFGLLGIKSSFTCFYMLRWCRCLSGKVLVLELWFWPKNSLLLEITPNQDCYCWKRRLRVEFSSSSLIWNLVAFQGKGSGLLLNPPDVIGQLCGRS